jgi:hypothetical protein
MVGLVLWFDDFVGVFPGMAGFSVANKPVRLGLCPYLSIMVHPERRASRNISTGRFECGRCTFLRKMKALSVSDSNAAESDCLPG